LKKPSWFFIIPTLSLASLISLVIAFFYSWMAFVSLGFFVINMAIHFWNKRNLYQYLGSIPQLLRLNGVAKELLKSAIFNEISRDVNYSIKTIDKVRNRMSFFKLQAKIETGPEMFFAAILELLKIMFLLEPLLLFGAISQLDTKRKEIEVVFSFVGKVDALISIASLRQGLGLFCPPEIKNAGKSLNAIELYHPLIEHCVANSIEVNNKSILLTGSNMSGKTSFIRAIGINVITGLTLNICFAAQFQMPKMRVYSAIRISDDLLNDKSYYFEELITIKEMITQSQNGAPNLFLLDEIFKGTNTIERIAAGKAVLSYLSKTDNIVFVSTHDIELADLLIEEYELYHFSEFVDLDTIDFDYQLKVGKLRNKNAIKILQINGYPKSIIEEAIAISKVLDKMSNQNAGV
jgi:DNA mismatch repair ATPase MutS